jgi:hypothetical protein
MLEVVYVFHFMMLNICIVVLHVYGNHVEVSLNNT